MPKFNWGWFAFWCGALVAGIMIALVNEGYIRVTFSTIFFPMVIAWAILNIVRVVGMVRMMRGAIPKETINRPGLPFPQDGPLSKPAADLQADLDRLGFRLLGQTTVDMPLGTRIQAWYFAHVTDPVYVEIAFSGTQPVTYLHTVFDDQSTIVTGWPDFEHMRGRHLWFSRVKKDFATAFTLHTQLIGNFTVKHDARPLHLTDIRVVLRWSRLYRQLYSRRQLRRPLIQTVIETLWSLVTFVVFGVDVAADFQNVILTPSTEITLGMIFVGMFFVFLVYQTLSAPKDSGRSVLQNTQRG